MTARKRSFATLLVLTLSAALIGTASAGTRGAQPDLRFGVYTDASAFALGGGLKTRVGTSGYWSFNPNLEMVFFDYGNFFTINGDFLYDIPSSGGPSFYLGAGPAILVGDSNTDLGVNLIGGLSASRGSSRPFVQMKAILGEGSELAIMGGVRF
jgi:hypothetical protein